MSDHFIKRNAEIRDIPAIAGFLRSMVGEMEKNGGHQASVHNTEWNRLSDKIIRDMNDDNHIYIVTEISGQNKSIIGFSEAKKIDRTFVYRPSRILHIHSLFVDVSDRGKGAGRSLLEAIMQWGREKRCQEVKLSVLVKNSARTSYKKLSFPAI